MQLRIAETPALEMLMAGDKVSTEGRGALLRAVYALAADCDLEVLGRSLGDSFTVVRSFMNIEGGALRQYTIRMRIEITTPVPTLEPIGGLPDPHTGTFVGGLFVERYHLRN